MWTPRPSATPMRVTSSRSTTPSSCPAASARAARSEEHTSELQSPDHLVCRLLLEKKNSKILSAHRVKPHKIQYYLERRETEIKPKMIEVLHVYRDVKLWRKARSPHERLGDNTPA